MGLWLDDGEGGGGERYTLCAKMQLGAFSAAMIAWLGFDVRIGAEWFRRYLLWW
jgi:hypothetical protein